MKQPADFRLHAGLAQRFATPKRMARERGARGDRLAFAENPLLALKLPAWRSRLLLFLLFAAFVAVTLRALYLQGGFKTEYLRRKGEMAQQALVIEPATRGLVTDRNGVPLAVSAKVAAIAAVPADAAKMSATQLAQLAPLLKMSAAELKERLDKAQVDKRKLVYLRRQVEPDVAKRIAALKLPGIEERPEFRRYYPEGVAVAHVVGFTSVDHRGQEGVELAFDERLAGRDGSRRVIRDVYGRVVEDERVLLPEDGDNLALALDHRIQHIAVSAVRQAVESSHAQAGAAVVLDVRTGEVLALANWPSFDPNEPSARTGGQRDMLRNRALTDTFEPGSTLKPFSVAAALDAGRVKPTQVFETAPGWIRVGDRTIRDHRAHGLLTVEQIVAKSSNVGTVKIALDLPAQALWETYTGVGFGQPVEIGFPGAVTGRLRPARAWREVEHATIAYGYGVSVSLMQLARAYTALARDGDVVPVSLLRLDAPPVGQRVLQPQTARAMRHMLELAVSEEGTAPAARIGGYRVAGKTGTARKLKQGRYVNEYVASFAGFAPVSDPRIVVAVMVDEPNGARFYGGDVAAPAFAQIATGTLRTLQVAPDAAGASLLAEAPGTRAQGGQERPL